MTKKETVYAVILGVALVSLASAVMSAIVAAFILLIDFGDLIGSSDYLYNYAIGVVELMFALVAIGLTVAIILGKKVRILLSVISAAVAVLYFIISVVILRENVGVYNGYVSTGDYQLYGEYVTAATALMISAVLSAIFFILFARKPKQTAEAAVAAQPNATVNAQPSAVPEAPAPMPQPAPQPAPAPKVQIDENVIYCPECGKKNKAAAKFCAGCGQKLN
ncbi:MAG: zinc ribbon domain-containing protein [Clostridiales bacterium]|nr:zinc ribbon domain-containing protein [Clostridiales bacterium]